MRLSLLLLLFLSLFLFSIAATSSTLSSTVCVQNIDLTCSANCQSCGGFGCLPLAATCPTPCSGYLGQSDCLAARKVNGIACQWNASCVFGPPDGLDPNTAAAVAGIAAQFAIRQQQSSLARMTPETTTSQKQPVKETTDDDGGGDDGAWTMTSKSAGQKWIIVVSVVSVVGGLAVVGLAVFFGDRWRKKRLLQEKSRENVIGVAHRRTSLLSYLRLAAQSPAVAANGAHDMAAGDER